MCSAIIKLTSNALGEISNAETLLKIKGVIALFIQTMEVCDNPIFNLCDTINMQLGIRLLGSKFGQLSAEAV